jgi:TM2 domain-containing membrane protein YozV
MRFLIFIIITLFAGINISAQKIPARIQFSEYLINQSLYEEAVYESNQILKLKLTKPQTDSALYFNGWAKYNLKQLLSSSKTLQQVSPESEFYSKSQLFGSYNLIHIGKYDQAVDMMNHFQKSNETEEHFSLFLQSGIQLINRNVEAYRTIANQLPQDYYGFAREVAFLNNLATSIENKRPKSPVLAGILSGIIPGSGQIYAGKTGQGIAAMLMASGLAVVALENYNKRGPEKFETIFFGSVFTVFYIGNIYGAAFSAKIANNENNELINRQILFNLHIPLRNIFD